MSRQLFELPTTRNITRPLIAIKVCQIKQTESMLALPRQAGRQLHRMWVVYGTPYLLVLGTCALVIYYILCQ